MKEGLTLEMGNTGKSRKQQLRHVRASLGMRQIDLAQAAGISEPTIVAIEGGKTQPRLTTAYAILDALNAELQKKNRPPLDIDSLTWHVQGEAEDDVQQ